MSTELNYKEIQEIEETLNADIKEKCMRVNSYLMVSEQFFNVMKLMRSTFLKASIIFFTYNNSICIRTHSLESGYLITDNSVLPLKFSIINRFIQLQRANEYNYNFIKYEISYLKNNLIN